MTKGFLSTHVLDIYNGKPGNGINVELYSIDKKRVKIKSFLLNKDGRTKEPILMGKKFKKGKYELIFYIGSYYKKINTLKKPYFLDDIVIRFGINNSSEHYHVPLLVSPWSYSTYRGS
ncbi:MAG: 5-hydroxyisourate hydrolase [Alphaproteobacteria bacterium MarineAlpha5_Bin9]|nr:MAG: 5-hydroxyisourate hydrolase [Alphaproteobacteria bacterium MarineAlpha5_Bin9]